MTNLKPGDIRYLAFEGGGGKGFAFLGALEALEQNGVYVPTGGGQPWGVAGSSAGAITALFVAMKTSASDIETLIDSTDFDVFFDAPDYGHHVGLFGSEESGSFKAWWSKHYEEVAYLLAGLKLGKHPTNSVGALAAGWASTWLRIWWLNDKKRALTAIPRALRTKVDREARDIAKKIKTSPAKAFDGLDSFVGQGFAAAFKETAVRLGLSEAQWKEYKALRAFDMVLDRPASRLGLLMAEGGLFRGADARLWLEGQIRQRMAEATGKTLDECQNTSFRKLEEAFGVEFAVVGSNLTTGKSEVFSGRATPHMPVATAVRISMGIPFVFTPVKIGRDAVKKMRSAPSSPDHMPDHKLIGHWVDGGLFNNIPLRVFESERRQDASLHTLGLRLDVEELRLQDPVEGMSLMAAGRKDTTGLAALVGALVGGYIGAGEAHIGESWNTAAQTIQLPTKGLDTLNFSPDRESAKRSKIASRQAVEEYFGE